MMKDIAARKRARERMEAEQVKERALEEQRRQRDLLFRKQEAKIMKVQRERMEKEERKQERRQRREAKGRQMEREKEEKRQRKMEQRQTGARLRGFLSVEHRQLREGEKARQREEARAKREAVRAEEEAERLAAEAKRRDRNRAMNAWTLRGQDHEPCTSQETRSWPVGMRVEALFQAQTLGSRRCSWYPGTVASEADAEGRCDVQYDDGDFEAHVPAAYLRPVEVLTPSCATAVAGNQGDNERSGSAGGEPEAQVQQLGQGDAQDEPAEASGRQPGSRALPSRTRVSRLIGTSDEAGDSTREHARGMGEGCRLDDEGGSGSEEDCDGFDWGESSDDASDEDYRG